MARNTLLTFKQRCNITDKALRVFYMVDVKEGQLDREDINDAILMHTEGGAADAIALAIARKQDAKTKHFIKDGKDK